MQHRFSFCTYGLTWSDRMERVSIFQLLSFCMQHHQSCRCHTWQRPGTRNTLKLSLLYYNIMKQRKSSPRSRTGNNWNNCWQFFTKLIREIHNAVNRMQMLKCDTARRKTGTYRLMPCICSGSQTAFHISLIFYADMRKRKVVRLRESGVTNYSPHRVS